MARLAPDAVKRLVDHFDQNREVFLSGDYKEEQLRAIRRSAFGVCTFLRASLTEVFKPVIVIRPLTELRNMGNIRLLSW